MNKSAITQSAVNSGKPVWSRLPVLIITAVFCCTLWGSAAPAIKVGYSFFSIGADDTASRLLFAGIRFTIAGLMVVAFGSLIGRKFLRPKKSSWKCIIILAAFQTVIQYIFYYMGLAHTSGVRGSIINASGSFFSIILAVVVFRFEKLSVKKVAGLLLGFFGVLLILTGGDLSKAGEGAFSFQGEGAFILAALSHSFAACFIKLFSEKEDPVMLSGYQFFFGGIVMTLIGLISGGKLIPQSPYCLPLIIYMGFISAGAYTLWGVLLKYNEVSTVTVLGFVNPVMGVLLSAAILNEWGELKNISTVLALVLVAFGIVVVNVRRREKNKDGG